ncbi:DNA-processing protein DprA [Desulfonatronospira sp.]|uniref:DNA-processing protein DprA n=1 Tax=Desulfonatronospira sp. TaxID=1962951 RepID=UPI0025BADEA0|nr:DNA-processing protein DprA [Desulfonatronospira sp.]
MLNYTRSDEIWACLALSNTRTLGCKTWQKILEVFRSPAQALANSSHWAEMGLVTHTQAGQFKSRQWEPAAAVAFERIQSGREQVLIWSDPEYPETLRHIAGPPILLYYLGNIALVQGPCLAVVGSRNSTAYGREMAFRICRELSSKGLTIVSGFAEGIDRQAHKAALEGPGSTIAVLGTGIDLIYPAVNQDLWMHVRERGLIVSEFPRGTKPEAHNFPYRNRIISGLSLGVLVMQAALKSGSMLTAGYALEQGREVFAMPGPVNQNSFTGCNHLIRQGALLVQSDQDILEALQPRLKIHLQQETGTGPVLQALPEPQLPPDLSSDEKSLAVEIANRERVHIDELTQKLNLTPSRINQLLVNLEIRGVVKREPGMYYKLMKN